MKLDFFLLEFFKLVKFTIYNKKAAGRTLLHVAGRQLHLGYEPVQITLCCNRKLFSYRRRSW